MILHSFCLGNVEAALSRRAAAVRTAPAAVVRTAPAAALRAGSKVGFCLFCYNDISILKMETVSSTYE